MPSKRILAVDVFRGATIALMILVNNPGTWSAIYPPFKHAEWFGVTLTDWVFPFFLFIVGTSIVLAYHKRPTDNFHTWKRIFSRTLKLLLLSWFLAGFTVYFPFFKNLSYLRIPGVLFRIGLVFFSGALIFLVFKWIWRKYSFRAGLSFLTGLFLLIILGYWYIMIGHDQLTTNIPNEQLISEKLNKTDNLVSRWDRKILGINHMWYHWDPESGKKVRGDYDPEGLLSTVPAIATAILGMFLGLILIRIKNPFKKISWFLLLGMGLLVTAYLFHFVFPYSKKLWTSSFVLYTGGWAFLVFTVIYLLVDFLHLKKPFFPLQALGMNAIAIFVLNGLIAKSFYQIKIQGTSLHAWLFKHTWHSWIDIPELASLLYALTVVLFYTLLAIYLYRKKIFIKV